MRLVAGVLSLALFAPFARAEDTATPPAASPPPAPAPAPQAAPAPPAARVPFRVVRVMPETRQALLFDRSRNTHILAEVGGQLDGYTIEDIDEDTVSLRRDNQQVVLAAPMHGGRARELPPVRLRSAAAPGFGAAAPAPTLSSGPAAPIDPYADPPRPAAGAAPAADALPPDPSIRVAHAGGTAGSPATGPVLVPGEGGVRVATAPDVGPGPGLSAAPSAPGRAAASWDPPSAGSTAPGPGAIRVVSAAPSAAPLSPSGLPTAPDAPMGAPSAPGAVPTAPGALAAPGAIPTAPGALAAPGAVPAAPGSALAAPGAAPAPWGSTLPASTAVPAAPGSTLAAPGAAPAAPGSTLVPGETTDPIATPPRVSSAAAIEPAADPRPAAIREVRAPDAARAPDRQTADARAMADILTADRPARSPRSLAEPAPARAPGAASPAVAGDGIAISRSELDGALADFARLTAGVRGSFSANGALIDAVGDGTIFQRAGLRAGDVVTSVDGVRLRTLDDAANLYARAATARAITAQVVRAGKPITLHVVIQ